MTTVPFSARRMFLVASATFQQAIRQRFFNLLGLLALGLVVGVRSLRDFNFGSSELKFVTDFGDGAIAFFGAVLTVVATAQLFLDEIEQRTALTMLAKAVWRTEFVLGKYLGVAGIAACFCGVMSLALGGVLWTWGNVGSREMASESVELASWAGGLVAMCWLQWLKLAMLGSGTLLIACFARTQIYTVMVGFSVWVVCHLQQLSPNQTGILQPVRHGIELVFPDFRLFSASFVEVAAMEDIARLSLYAGGHVAVTCALAVYVFSKREL